MPILNIAVSFPDDQWMPFLNSLGPFQTVLLPPGVYLYRALEELSKSLGGKPLTIVETGCWRDASPSSLMSDGWSTYYFARWVKDHSNSRLITLELEKKNLDLCFDLFKQYELPRERIFWSIGDSVESIKQLSPYTEIDVFFLDSCDGLEHGLEEFKAALAHKPKLIIMDDFATKAAKAFEYALSLGIKPQTVDRYTFFSIPQ